jgi:hypothetical protein
MSDEEEVDFAAYEKDEPGESKAAKAAVKAAAGKVATKAAEAKDKNFQDAIAQKAAVDAANKEIADIQAGMNPDQKARMLAAQRVIDAAKGAASPLSRRSDYDHEGKQKNLVKNTVSVRVEMEKLKDDYECVHYMGSLCDYWKSLMPLDHAQANEHTCFMNYFKKERHLYGLPLYVPASPGSKNVSRGTTPGPIDEEDGAGAN